MYTNYKKILSRSYSMTLAITSDTIMPWLILGVGIICWLWAIYECIKDPRLEGQSRARWILFVILVPGIGALCYLLARRSDYKASNYSSAPPKIEEKQPLNK